MAESRGARRVSPRRRAPTKAPSLKAPSLWLRVLALETGPLRPDLVSVPTLHRLRRVSAETKAAAEAALGRFPEVLATGGSTYPAGSPNLVCRQTAEVLDLVSMEWLLAPPGANVTAAACCAVSGGRVFVGGGSRRDDCGQMDCICTEDVQNGCSLFDPATLAWRELPPLPVAVAAPLVVALGGTVLLLGGAREPNLSDPAEARVTLSFAEYEASAADHDWDYGEIHVVTNADGTVSIPIETDEETGAVDAKFWRGTRECYKLEVDNPAAAWHAVQPLPRSARGGACAVLASGELFFAGETWTPTYLRAISFDGRAHVAARAADVLADLDGGAPGPWRDAAPMPATNGGVRRAGVQGACGCAALGGSRVLVVGGARAGSGASQSALRVYDAAADAWSTLAAKMPRPLDGCGVVALGCTVLFVGGHWQERHPHQPGVVRFNALAGACLYDVDTGRILVLPPMRVPRAGPAVAAVKRFTDGKAYRKWVLRETDGGDHDPRDDDAEREPDGCLVS
ncbi:hypothetical protein M885DRAFT_508371 [Pelagophyceae sp. CCMP2097]|nr:hypothetical protein M885DRAFT_508371 [Pelagophyceae sp. CCMP2097]